MEIIGKTFTQLSAALQTHMIALTSYIREAVGGNDLATGMVITAVMGSLVYGLRSYPRKIYHYIVGRFLYTYNISFEMPPNSTINSADQRFVNKLRELALSTSLFRKRFATVRLENSTVVPISGHGSTFLKINGVYMRLNTVVKDTQNSSESGMSNAQVCKASMTCLIWNKDKLLAGFNKLMVSDYVPSVVTTNGDHFRPAFFTTRNLVQPKFYGIDASLKADIDKLVTEFINNRELYKELGIPYRLTIMLYGPPGTGKTSIAEYITMKFNTSMFYIDGVLLKALGNMVSKMRLSIPEGRLPVILFDDVDAHYTGLSPREDDDVGNNSPMGRRNRTDLQALGAFLSFLDSSIAPDNLVTIVTTNHLENLDSAITRPGRFNGMFKVDTMCDETIRSIYKNAYGIELIDPYAFDDLRACDVGEAYKANLTNPQGFVDHLKSQPERNAALKAATEAVLQAKREKRNAIEAV